MGYSRNSAVQLALEQPRSVGRQIMRVTAGLITVLCMGVLSQALAAEPPAPSPPSAPAAPAPAPADQQSATAPGGQAAAATPAGQQNAASPTAASAPAKPGITVVGTKPELTPQDKELLSRGYKLEMRHGEKYFCRTETQIDSRFPIKNCDTAQSIESQRASSQEALRVITNDRSMVNK